MDMDDEQGLQDKIVEASAEMVFQRIFSQLTADDWTKLREAVVATCVDRIKRTPDATLKRIWSDYTLERMISNGVSQHSDVTAAFAEVTNRLAPALAKQVRSMADNIEKTITRRLTDAFR